MQRDFFLSTLINDRAHPMVQLPPGVIVTTADRVGVRYRSGDVTAMSLPALCQRLIAQGCSATHLQVYDAAGGARVPMTFMSIADTAAWPGRAPHAATKPAAIPAAGTGVAI